MARVLAGFDPPPLTFYAFQLLYISSFAIAALTNATLFLILGSSQIPPLLTHNQQPHPHGWLIIWSNCNLLRKQLCFPNLKGSSLLAHTATPSQPLFHFINYVFIYLLSPFSTRV